MQERSIKILLVEDDDGHARLIEKNLRRAGLSNEIVRVENGKKALDYIFGDIVEADQDKPGLLVLLDINLPVVSGGQVLEAIKSDPRTRLVPVIMLSTTDNPAEIARCYDLGCNAYVTKPVGCDRFAETVVSLGCFVSIVNLPSQAAVR